MQNTSEIIFDVMELVVAFHTRIIQNLSYQKIYKTNTTKQDLLWRDSLHGSRMDFIEQELDMKEMQKTISD